MKRLFRIGSGLLIYSIIPILSWIVLSHILGDVRISNVFSLTYAIQFIWAILKYYFGSAGNIRKEKENDTNSVWNSIFWGVISSMIIFAIPLIFVDQYITFFGQDPDFYRIYVIYSIVLFFLQTLLSLIIEKFYFENKEKTANLHLFMFNLINFAVLILSCWIIPNTLIALLLTLGVLTIYIVCLYVTQFEKFKINFSFLKNFRYESANIVSSLFMFIIYLFGLKTAFSMGPEYLAASNVVCLCTDAQWDMLYAVETVAKVDISQQQYDYKRQVKYAHIYTFVMVLFSITMALILSWINKVVMSIALIYLAFQVVDMLLDPMQTILSTYTQLEYSATLNTVINFSLKVLRTVLSISLLTPYCTEIGQVASGILAFITFMIIRITKYKLVDNKLIIKKKEKQQILDREN